MYEQVAVHVSPTQVHEDNRVILIFAKHVQNRFGQTSQPTLLLERVGGVRNICRVFEVLFCVLDLLGSLGRQYSIGEEELMALSTGNGQVGVLDVIDRLAVAGFEVRTSVQLAYAPPSRYRYPRDSGRSTCAAPRPVIPYFGQDFGLSRLRYSIVVVRNQWFADLLEDNGKVLKHIGV